MEDAMAVKSEAANFFAEVERGVLDEGEKGSCAGGRRKEANEDGRGLSSRKKDIDGKSYVSRKLLIEKDGEDGRLFAQTNAMVPESYGSRSFFAEEELEGASSQKKGMADDSYGSRRFFLSCSVASERAKKKRRSRATSKAPIKVFSTDASNFMAMVHKLTGIPSNTFPFPSPLPAPASSTLLPFNQGLPTLDTSAMLLPSFACDRVSNGNGYSSLQASPSQQQLNSFCLDMQNSNQTGQALTNMDATSLSYSDLMRSMCSTDSSSLPCLWEASHIKQKNAHKLQESCISEREGPSRQKGLHQGMTKELTLPVSSNLSSLEILLAAQNKQASTDAWASSTSIVKSNIAKEELL